MTATSDKSRGRLQALEKLLDEDPRSLAFVSLAEEHIRLEEHGAAAEVAQRGLQAHPDSVAGRLVLAKAEARQNHIRKALEQIKRALVIDQENPPALALMGEILLQKGLAKRAVQFLSHAVRLAPDEPEYAEALREAKKQAKGAEAPVPALRGDQLSESESPWGDDSVEEYRADADHTVFDPDAALKDPRNRNVKLDEALRSVPNLGIGMEDSEPTRFDETIGKKAAQRSGQTGERKPPSSPAAPIRDVVHEDEEPTAHAAHVEELARAHAGESPGKKTPGSGKKAQMGGSALELSKILPRAEADAALAAGAKAAQVSVSTPPDAPIPPEPSSPSKAPRNIRELGDSAVKNGGARDVPSRGDQPAARRKPPPDKRIGPAATRMVDEALWALFGQKGPAEPPPPPPAPELPEGLSDPEPSPAKKAAPAPKEAKAQAEAAGERGGPMVVRTSERFGTWVRVSVIAVLAVSALWLAYALTVSRAGPGPEVAGEEIRGLATDLDRGGLAALQVVEEQVVDVLLPSNPNLANLLNGVLAEVYARQWHDFGRNPRHRREAKKRIEAYGDRAPTVELLSAMVMLSTSTAERSKLDAALEKSLEQYPESPKTWLARARAAGMDGRKDAALRYIYRARALNPQHRGVLLSLARWHGDNGSFSSAFQALDRLQDLYQYDVEGAIDRYVLGQLSGRDPSETRAASILAGLVREESPQVAKDEMGRAALVFAVPMFARGEIQEGINELGKAEAAFQESADFRATVAGMFLAVGEWSRAKRHYARALELEPGNEAHRIGLARTIVGERADYKLDFEAERKKRRKVEKTGFAELPFATLRLRIGKFSLVDVAPNEELFPEGAYARRAAALDGDDLQKALEAESLLALAMQHIRGTKIDQAVQLLQDAQEMFDSPELQVALGRAYLAQGKHAIAERALQKALERDPKNIAARVALLKSLVAQEKKIAALEILEGLEAEGIVVPAALYEMARIRMERGDDQGAERSLRVLAEMDPGNVAGLVALGEVQYRLGHKAEALESFKKAVSVAPRLTSQGAVVQNRPLGAVALLHVGRMECDSRPRRGAALLQRVLRFADRPGETRYWLGKCFLKMRRTRRQGKKELERYLAEFSTGELAADAKRLLGRR